jgi:hypothetical protein
VQFLPECTLGAHLSVAAAPFLSGSDEWAH